MGKEKEKSNKDRRQSIAPESEDDRPRPPPRSFNRALPSIVEQSKLRKKRPFSVYDEVYCDKDRAAAVSIGNFDIKQSLSQKRRQDQTQAMAVQEEADPSALIALGMREIKGKNLDNGVLFLSKALEVTPTDPNALIARSNCYLQLGEPQKALEDAETALNADKANIRAIYQKAESLYYLGQFEHSLMFFHRGLKLRPELACFRLGIQKTQEAIENTIGGQPKGVTSRKSAKPKASKKLTKDEAERRSARKLLGELFVDKEYLEKLLNHPDLVKADTKTENISDLAKDAINFLNNRQEFWRQQKKCQGMFVDKKLLEGELPGWL